MASLIHEIIFEQASLTPNAEALSYQGQRWTYAVLADQVESTASALCALGLNRGERVAVYLEKRVEAVAALFATAAAGGVFVPVNPLLKPQQVAYILTDCNVRIMVTSVDRLGTLANVLSRCHDLTTVIVVGAGSEFERFTEFKVVRWNALNGMGGVRLHRRIDRDMAAILYTSGSTGKSKGVVLSHQNMITGARSVAGYLENTSNDRILAVLPLSFDYGLSQLTTAFFSGASVVLLNYLFPRDVIKAVEKERITGLAAVPPLWIQLAHQTWPKKTSLRYITNSGGAMQRITLDMLRRSLPETKVYLMYGLTEAFRSTFLPPSELDRRPDSIGHAIPDAEIMVVRKDGTPCGVNEPGELIHRGSLVALGYWNDPEKTAERFRPVPLQAEGLSLAEIAVWSGDTVRMDENGFLYFIGRDDDMIKVSGFRVSPTEVEEAISRIDMVAEVAAFGVPHPVLGQAIVVVVQGVKDSLALDSLIKECRYRLPGYMVPLHIEICEESLPRNSNGKIDRKLLRTSFADLFNKDGQGE